MNFNTTLAAIRMEGDAAFARRLEKRYSRHSWIWWFAGLAVFGLAEFADGRQWSSWVVVPLFVAALSAVLISGYCIGLSTAWERLARGRERAEATDAG